MLFNDAVALYIVSVVDEWVWSIAGIRLTGESPKYSKRKRSYRYFDHHVAWTERGPSRWDAGN